MTAAHCIVVIEASSREQLIEDFARRSTHLTWAQIRKRFDDLLHHGYADAQRGEDGKWRLVLLRVSK
jgi:hypothetical protein